MKSLSQIANCKLEVVSRKLQKSNLQLTSYEVRLMTLAIAGDLACIGDEKSGEKNMTGWLCKCFKTLGESKFAACASIAKQPEVINRKRMFNFLLKEEMQKYYNNLKSAA